MKKNKDFLILSMLRQNSRETLTNISKKTKVPISTLYDKLKNNNEGFIIKHTSLLNFNELGYLARANVMVKVEKGDRAKLGEYLKNNMCVNSLCKINNGFDFFFEGVFRNLKELEDFMEKIEQDYNVENKKIHYIIDELKREEFMSNPAFVDILSN